MLGMTQVRTSLLAVAAACALATCKATAPQAVCTAQVVALALVVRAPDGSPVPGLTISDTILRTRQAITYSPPPIASRARIIFDDSFRTTIRPEGDSVRVAGTTGTTGFSANFIFDVPYGCHVSKLAGPDSVTVP